jgi:hypothetical protein
MQVQQMISMHPDVRGSTNDALIRCIEECYSCAQTCTSCADACLAEEMVKELTQCVRLNLDCADVCNITGRIATRRTGSDDELIRRMLVTCAAACRLCGDECERHASRHEHCRSRSSSDMGFPPLNHQLHGVDPLTWTRRRRLPPRRISFGSIVAGRVLEALYFFSSIFRSLGFPAAMVTDCSTGPVKGWATTSL